MVVRFTPTPDGGSTEPRGTRSAARPTSAAAPDSGERLAPVSYLPGARPSGAAQDALRRVESVRKADTSRGASALVGAAHRESARGGGRPDTGRGASRAANVSLHQLARRGMSRWELQQVLNKRDVDEATATAELDRLQSVGLLDDAALALTLVYTQHTRKGLGRSAIAHELKRRHIDQTIIDDALSEIEDDDELQRALELAHKRAPQFRGLDEQTARRRLSGYLARKGYGSDVLRAAMASVFDKAVFDKAVFEKVEFDSTAGDDGDVSTGEGEDSSGDDA